VAVRVRGVVALIVAGWAAGCGSDAGSRSAAPRAAESLVALSRAAVERCSALAPRRAIPVLCPTRLTPGRWRVRYQTLRSGRREYLCNLETTPAGSGAAFHVLAGGRSRPFSLSSTASGGWPRDPRLPRDLGLIGSESRKRGQRSLRERRIRPRLIRRTTVSTHSALLLRVADYPDGGVHGGHLAVVWNQGEAGYALSIHFSERDRHSPSEREAVLLEVAGSMSRFTAAGSG
jgi:hypothetical protein